MKHKLLILIPIVILIELGTFVVIEMINSNKIKNEAVENYGRIKIEHEMRMKEQEELINKASDTMKQKMENLRN